MINTNMSLSINRKSWAIAFLIRRSRSIIPVKLSFYSIVMTRMLLLNDNFPLSYIFSINCSTKFIASTPKNIGTSILLRDIERLSWYRSWVSEYSFSAYLSNWNDNSIIYLLGKPSSRILTMLFGLDMELIINFKHARKLKHRPSIVTITSYINFIINVIIDGITSIPAMNFSSRSPFAYPKNSNARGAGTAQRNSMQDKIKNMKVETL